MQLNSYSNYHANTLRPGLHPRIQVESIQSISSTTHRLTPRFHAYAHMQALTINKRKKNRKKAQKVWGGNRIHRIENSSLEKGTGGVKKTMLGIDDDNNQWRNNPDKGDVYTCSEMLCRKNK
jgi:hypothetical protein